MPGAHPPIANAPDREVPAASTQCETGRTMSGNSGRVISGTAVQWPRARLSADSRPCQCYFGALIPLEY